MSRLSPFENPAVPAAADDTRPLPLPTATPRRPTGPAPGDELQAETNGFLPREPQRLDETRLALRDLESLILKILLNADSMPGRQIAERLKLPFRLVRGVLQVLKQHMLVGYKNSAAMGDYEYELSQTGLERAQACNERCTYCGAAPVALDDYIDSVHKQSLRHARAELAALCAALDDLVLEPERIGQLGQAVMAGRSLLLYGPPGNGKTAVARRLMRSVRQPIWIPRAITVSGEIIRLFDPRHHVEQPLPQTSCLLNDSPIDHRWVRIRRPTVVVGSELTLDRLDLRYNNATGTYEAPVHLQSNGGALVIDDFGRQRVDPAQLLNRWILPMEQGWDYITLATGRQVQVPVQLLLVFTTNLQPSQLMDEAALRRIAYKIEMTDPTPAQFRDLLCRVARQMGFAPADEVVDYLITTHFTQCRRPLRFSYAQAILDQVSTWCRFHDRPLELNRQTVDAAMKNYFASL